MVPMLSVTPRFSGVLCEAGAAGNRFNGFTRLCAEPWTKSRRRTAALRAAVCVRGKRVPLGADRMNSGTLRRGEQRCADFVIGSGLSVLTPLLNGARARNDRLCVALTPSQIGRKRREGQHKETPINRVNG